MEQINRLLGGEHPPYNETLRRCFNDLFSRQCLASGAIVAGTTSTKPKITTAIPYVLSGVAALIPAADSTISWVESGGTTLPTYSLTATQIGGYVLTIDNGGLYHALALTPSAALTSAPGWPTIPPTHVVFGHILVNTSNAAVFTANTTALSASNVTLINFTGPHYPTNVF